MLPFFTQQCEAGGLARLGGQRCIAQSAAAALGGFEGGALADEIGKDGAVRIQDHRAVGNLQDQVVAGGTVTVVAHPGFTVGPLRVRTEVEVEKRVHLGIDHQSHRPAVAAVAAVGTTERFELLAVHRRAAVTAVTRRDVDGHAVDEPGHRATPFLRSLSASKQTGRAGTR